MSTSREAQLNQRHARDGGSEDQGQLHPIVDLRTTRAVGIATRLGPESPDLEAPIRTAADLWHSGLGLQLAIELPPGSDSALADRIDDALEQTGLPARALQLGIADEALPDEGVIGLIEPLRERGVTFSVTGFGTGRVSIQDLVRRPINCLNLDPALIRNPPVDEETRIVRSSVHLAHQLGMQVVAEGVDDGETWRRLRSLGVDRARGPLVSRPLFARQVPAWLAAWNGRARELAATGRFRPERTVAV
jgi:EAL domain-containing protein (putative c-di-GMP-specific phosphodiesterase class I)